MPARTQRRAGGRMLRSLRSLLFLAPLLAIVAPFLTPTASRALPLWSRQYSVTCNQCHSAFPRLNSFGMAFRQNGYRMEGQPGQPITEAKEIPLSIVGNVGFAYTRTNVADIVDPTLRDWTAESGFQQNAVELHSAGTLAEKVSFHFDSDFDSDTGFLASGSAFVQFDDLGKGGALNLRAGIFDADIPYLAGSRNTTLQGYLTPVTLDARGVELNGTCSGWTYAAGLINSERDPLNAKPGTRTFNRFENVYVWLMRDLKGQLVAARVFVDRQDPRVPTASTSQHLMAQVSTFLNSGRFIVIPGYTYETFEDAPTAGEKGKIQTGLLEAMVLLGKDQRWVVTGRGEIQHLGKTSVSPNTDFRSTALNLAFLVAPNARLALEWAHTSDNIAGPRVDEIQTYVHVGY
jgi:hypothetical protein